jgi:hypothetical protein
MIEKVKDIFLVVCALIEQTKLRYIHLLVRLRQLGELVQHHHSTEHGDH